MATWKIESSDGRSWTIEAPDNIPEREVLDFADEHADSWVDGGRYRLDESSVDVTESTPERKADVTSTTERNTEVDAAVKSLTEQIDAFKAEQAKLPARKFAGPTLTGGSGGEVDPVTGFVPAADAVLDRRAEIEAKVKRLTAQRDALTLGSAGQTVGGVGGALLGAGTGVALGSPLGPPGMAVGGVLGSILGAAGGVALGTHLYDIPEAQQVRDISDAEAAELIKSRVIESLIWDGAFVLALGPGGRLIGKMVNGAKFAPALKAVAKDSVAWDEIAKSKKAQLEDVVAKRAAQAQPGLATEVSTALGVKPVRPARKAVEKLVGDIAERSGGRVPTKGEMTGVVSGGENFVRGQAPKPFFHNDRVLADAAESIRKTALNELDTAGAYGSFDMGTAVSRVADSAEKSLRATTGPIFDRAAQQLVRVDVSEAFKYVDDVLARDARSAGRLLSASERADLTGIQQALRDQPFLRADAAQDFISGNKARLRGIASDGTKPGEFMARVLGDLNGIADKSYLQSLGKVKDATLVRDLLGARKLYRETLGTLYSDTMVSLARKNPEDMGRALTGKGTITEIRELRKTLSGAVDLAPAAAVSKGGKVTELGKEAVMRERARIDAGMIKGFIEKNTQSLADLEIKLRDSDFRATLKELLVGSDSANPALGRSVMDELDRVVGVVKLIKPERAPQPGRLGVPGMGSVGAGTVVGGVTGQGITPITVGTVIGTMTGMRMVSRMIATAMTSGNAGALRTLSRAVSLAPAAGKNAAAAEVLSGLIRELDAWDRANGGEGLGVQP